MPQKRQFYPQNTNKPTFVHYVWGREDIIGQGEEEDMENVLLDWKLQQPIRTSLIMINHERVN